MLKSIKILIILIILALLFIGGYKYWLHQQRFPSTDDAYLQSNVVNIAPSISGRVISVHVKNQQQVRQGQALFEIDPLPYKILLNKAQSVLRNTEQEINAKKQAVISAENALQEHLVQLKNQQRQTSRTLKLVRQKVIAADEGDKALEQLNVVRAEVATAKSDVANAKAQVGDSDAQIKAANDDINTAKLNLNHTYIAAPANGTINNLSLRPGDSVNAYQSVFALVETKPQWVSANFKETQLLRIHPGQQARVKIDMYPNHIFYGTVENISSGSGTSFSLIPTEQATGNWVKVTQRFPVKILLKNDPKQHTLRLGSSASVTIDTTKHSFAATGEKY